MAKIKCKGTALQLDISTVYTAVAQLISHTPPPLETTEYDSTTLDTSGAGRESELTGYADGGEFAAEIFWDPELAVHAAITDAITTPAETNWKTIYVNSGASEMAYTCTGLKFSPAVAMDDGLKATITGKVDQLPVITV